MGLDFFYMCHGYTQLCFYILKYGRVSSKDYWQACVNLLYTTKRAEFQEPSEAGSN
jgi:hypothetical protein